MNVLKNGLYKQFVCNHATMEQQQPICKMMWYLPIGNVFHQHIKELWYLPIGNVLHQHIKGLWYLPIENVLIIDYFAIHVRVLQW